MNRDLYIHTLQGMRDVFAHEHMDTQVESLDVAIWAIETQEQLKQERDAAIECTCCEYRVGDECCYSDVEKDYMYSNDKEFVELVVQYPDPETCTYPEYKGKPYYGIKYIENGETIIGFGTYNTEVLSQYLKEYFMREVN